MDVREAIYDAVMAGSRALIGVAARSLASVSDEVSLAQYRVLVLLDGHGTLTMRELADNLDVSPSTVTRVCDVLVDKELIQRSNDPASRRVVQARLTAKGKRLVAQVMRRRRALIRDALAGLSDDAQQRLARAMADLAGVLGEVSADAWTLGWSMADKDSGEAAAN